MEPGLMRRLVRVRDLMDRAYAEPLGVPPLAELVHASSAHFSRAFKEAFGETPHRYLMTRRMERATALLRDTDLPVTEVCVAVGFSSLGSFSARFRELVGESPSEYRSRWRGSPEAVAARRIPSCWVRRGTRPVRVG